MGVFRELRRHWMGLSIPSREDGAGWWVEGGGIQWQTAEDLVVNA